MIKLLEEILIGSFLIFDGIYILFIIHYGKTKIADWDFSNGAFRLLTAGAGFTFLGVWFWASALNLYPVSIDNKVRLIYSSVFLILLTYKYRAYKDSQKLALPENIQKFYLIVFIVGILQTIIALLFIR